MSEALKIGIIGNYYGRPLDIILPIINESELSDKHNNSGHVFHVYSLEHTKLLLFSISQCGQKNIAYLDIHSACKPNSDISLLIVKTIDGQYLLRAYTDEVNNKLFPLPHSLYY